MEQIRDAGKVKKCRSTFAGNCDASSNRHELGCTVLSAHKISTPTDKPAVPNYPSPPTIRHSQRPVHVCASWVGRSSEQHASFSCASLFQNLLSCLWLNHAQDSIWFLCAAQETTPMPPRGPFMELGRGRKFGRVWLDSSICLPIEKEGTEWHSPNVWFTRAGWSSLAGG